MIQKVMAAYKLQEKMRNQTRIKKSIIQFILQIMMTNTSSFRQEAIRSWLCNKKKMISLLKICQKLKINCKKIITSKFILSLIFNRLKTC